MQVGKSISLAAEQSETHMAVNAVFQFREVELSWTPDESSRTIAGLLCAKWVLVLGVLFSKESEIATDCGVCVDASAVKYGV